MVLQNCTSYVYLTNLAHSQPLQFGIEIVCLFFQVCCLLYTGICCGCPVISAYLYEAPYFFNQYMPVMLICVFELCRWGVRAWRWWWSWSGSWKLWTISGRDVAKWQQHYYREDISGCYHPWAQRRLSWQNSSRLALVVKKYHFACICCSVAWLLFNHLFATKMQPVGHFIGWSRWT